MAITEKNYAKLITFFLFLGYLIPISTPQAASFNCAEAQTKVEHLICDNSELSKLDDELHTAYNTALKDKKREKGIRQSQKQWLEWRDGCTEAACVKWAYEAILPSMKNPAVAAKAGEFGNQRASYIIGRGVGKGEPFCEAIVAALNKTKSTAKQRPCISEEVIKMPGVSDPAWEKLDLSQHEELAKEIITLGIVGSGEYFRKVKTNTPYYHYPTPEEKQRELDGEKKLGAELFVMKIPPELFGDRALVTLRFKNNMCGRPIKLPLQPRGEVSHSAWVSANLKSISSGPGFFDSNAGRPMLYHGQLYLMRVYGGSTSLELYLPRHEYISRICHISLSIKANTKGEQK